MDQYQFVAAAGESITIEAIGLTGVIGLINVCIYTPSASLLVDTCRGRVSETLPESGTYRLEVSDCMRNDGEAGPYTVTLNARWRAAGEHVRRHHLRRAVVDPAVGDRVSFDVAEGEIVSISVLTDAASAGIFSASWLLVDSAGTPVSPCNAFIPWGPHTTCGPLS